MQRRCTVGIARVDLGTAADQIDRNVVLIRGHGVMQRRVAGARTLCQGRTALHQRLDSGEVAFESARAAKMATYALCGFANLGSIGILVGGVGSLIPDRKSELAELGIRAMLAATMANFLTACIAGLLA